MKLARFYGVTTDWILFGEDFKGKPNETLVYIPDSKLKEFVTLLAEMWREGNQDLRGWMTIQLEKTFPEIALKMKKNK